MNSLINPLQAIISKAAATLPVATGAADRAKKQSDARPNVLAILDVSASMALPGHGGQRRIDILRTAIAALPPMPLLSFSTTTTISMTIPEPCGSTNMAAALREGAAMNPRTVIVISDGQPDDDLAALRAARHFQCAIHTLFVGPEIDREAIDFMAQLAKAGMTWGRSDIHDLRLSHQAPLSSAIAALIGP